MPVPSQTRMSGASATLGSDCVAKMLCRVLRQNIELETLLDPAFGNVRADIGQIGTGHREYCAINAHDAMHDGGQVDLRDQERGVDRGVYRSARRHDPGPACHAGRVRHRCRDRCRYESAHVRAVLHHQGEGQGHRPRAFDGLQGLFGNTRGTFSSTVRRVSAQRSSCAFHVRGGIGKADPDTPSPGGVLPGTETILLVEGSKSRTEGHRAGPERPSLHGSRG